jgi:hypothetical protein
LPVQDFTGLTCPAPMRRSIMAGSQLRLIRRVMTSSPAMDAQLWAQHPNCHPAIGVLPGSTSCHCRGRGLQMLLVRSPSADPMSRPARRPRRKPSRQTRLAKAPLFRRSMTKPQKSAPENRSASLNYARRKDRYAAFWFPMTVGPLALPLIGIERGFFASGISRTKSTCKRPFSRLAPFTWTKSAS